MPPSASGSTWPRATRGRCPRSSEGRPRRRWRRCCPRCSLSGSGRVVTGFGPEEVFMSMTYLPPTQELHALFIDEVSAMGCVCPDVYDDGVGLYARAFFSTPVDVRPGDAVQGGVALRAVGEFVDVHPFVYRQVCTNGAIVADAFQSRRVQRVGMAAPTVAITAA